ncbi:MAG TPA: ribosomal protein S18-alanine N-acetyltransferase [Clostridia bacterium]|jgi:ribosomal-protein-alanine N-acetyltransferase|nr:ribosomal protein S18-alanine N-acetyltransferase [Clostridia bacterium]
MSNTVDLIIDSTRTKLALVLLFDNKYDFYICESSRRRHASSILTEIDKLLQRNALKKDVIKTIGVVIGPGSFTGIRIGVSTANALSYALNAKVIAINSLELIIGHNERGIAVLDCGNGNYYALERDGLVNNYYYIANEDDISRYIIQGINVYREGAFSETALINTFLKKKENADYVKKAVPFYIRETSADRQMESKYSVRKASDNELSNIANMELEIFPTPWTKESLSTYVNESNCLVLIHNDEINSIVGYIIYQAVSDDEIEILKIAIKTEFRGAGLGNMLLSELNKEALAHGVKNIILEVAENNIAAIRLYEKNNFQKEGIRKKYYNNKTNAILYRRKI